MNRFATIIAMLITAGSAQAADRWDSLPETPALHAEKSGAVKVAGADIHYSLSGKGPAVVLLHGGPANSNYLANQFSALKKGHQVIAIDTRGHGQSTLGEEPLSYDRMADDVVAVLDKLGVEKAAVVGWSDGAITGLDLAMRHSDRVTKVFAFGANTTTAGVEAHPDERPAFGAFLKRAEQEYNTASKDKDQTFTKLNDALTAMYATQPNWTAQQLGGIKVPVLVADGDRDEVIKREHTEEIARSIPGAGLLILPNSSHFAFLQDPALFNAAMLDFIGG